MVIAHGRVLLAASYIGMMLADYVGFSMVIGLLGVFSVFGWDSCILCGVNLDSLLGSVVCKELWMVFSEVESNCKRLILLVDEDISCFSLSLFFLLLWEFVGLTTVLGDRDRLEATGCGRRV